MKNVLVQAGLGPEPHDHPDTWSDFLKRHAATMWQCDFACKRKWTIRGIVDLYFLVFIHIESPRIWISPCTANPTGDWTTQQARNFQTYLIEADLPCTILMRDNDRKYVDDFDKVFTASNCMIKRNVIASPNLQAFVERVIQTLKHDVRNAFCILNESLLNCILRVAQDWYNFRRGHSGRDHLPPIWDGDPPVATDFNKVKIVCREELGGQLKSFRAAA